MADDTFLSGDFGAPGSWSDPANILSGGASAPPAPAGPVVGMNGSPTEAAAANIPAPNPNVSVKPPSKWEMILTGALRGLAGAQGAKTFGGGLAGGAKASLEGAQQDKQNAMAETELASRVRFQNAQAASLAVETAIHDKQLHNMDQQQQDTHIANALEQLKSMQGLGLQPTLVVDNHATGAMTGLQQLTDSHGAVPPMFTINLGNKIVGFDLNQLSQAPQTLSEVNKIRTIQGQQPFDARTWAQLPAEARNAQTNAAYGFYNPLPSEANLQVYNNYLNTVKAAPTGADRDANVAKLQNIVTTMKTALDNENARATQQAASKASVVSAAEAKARQPFEMAKAQFDQKLKDGDPREAGRMLANNLIAPSQIISARNPSFAQQAFASAKQFNPQYDPQVAEAQFKNASSPSNLAFFGSANSLLDTGGTLDQLAAAYKDLPNGKIPAFNKLSDWVAAAAGSGPVAKYASVALGVADDYSKVMGGGQGSDTSREQALHLIATHSGTNEIDGAISGIRGAVGSQRDSRIGRNPVLKAMYGSQAGPTATFDPKTDFKPIGQQNGR